MNSVKKSAGCVEAHAKVSNEMTARVNVGFVGDGTANEVFGGYLDAWSFKDFNDPIDWYSRFRDQVISAIGNRHLPIYRMADGEYRFLMGRKLNLRKRPLLRELAGYFAETIGLRRQWSTSWGETYDPNVIAALKTKLLENIANISSKGFLAPYIYDNGIHAFEEYNSAVVPFLRRHQVLLSDTNYVPFHFPVTLLVDDGHREFYEGRHIVLATSFSDDELENATATLRRLGALRVSYVAISPKGSLLDCIDLSHVERPVDLCLVAAGIGAANILDQLSPLKSVAIDIGGFMRCFVDLAFRSHCLFSVPRGSL